MRLDLTTLGRNDGRSLLPQLGVTNLTSTVWLGGTVTGFEPKIWFFSQSRERTLPLPDLVLPIPDLKYRVHVARLPLVLDVDAPAIPILDDLGPGPAGPLAGLVGGRGRRGRGRRRGGRGARGGLGIVIGGVGACVPGT